MPRHRGWIGNLRRARLAKGLTAPELVARLRDRGIEVSTCTVWGWEAGRSFPKPNVIPVLARVLGITTYQLLSYLEEAKMHRAEIRKRTAQEDQGREDQKDQQATWVTQDVEHTSVAG